jgi:hypothetical protein
MIALLWMSWKMQRAFTPMELRHINAVRIHLQVATLSEIATADGKRITDDVMRGIKSTSRTSELTNWIRQPKTTKEQRRLWNSALSKYFLHNESHILKTPLGSWIDNPTQQWATYYDLKKQVLYCRGSSGFIYEHMNQVISNRKPRGGQLFDEGILTNMPNSVIPSTNVVPASP